MANELKDILAGVSLTQAGKPVSGEALADNIVVRPLKGGPYVKANGQEVLAVLRAAHPKAAFLWISDPAKGDKGGAKDT